MGRERAVWVSNRAATFRKSPDGARIGAVSLGEGFEVNGESGGWLNISNSTGKTGYLKKSETSSYWLLIEKSKKILTFYDLRKPLDNWRVDFGPEPVGDKVRRGDNKTPEGEFYVCRKVPNSRFYRAFLISYPDIGDADQGLKNGIISAGQHAAIVRAIKSKGVPPQDTGLGGDLEIHGSGTGGLYNWTLGCVAVRDSVMDFMWDKAPVGTPIVIVP